MSIGHSDSVSFFLKEILDRKPAAFTMHGTNDLDDVEFLIEGLGKHGIEATPVIEFHRAIEGDLTSTVHCRIVLQLKYPQ